MKSRFAIAAVFGLLLLTAALLTYSSLVAQDKKKSAASKQMIKRGEYLVTVGVCDDCHSPEDLYGRRTRDRYNKASVGTPGGRQSAGSPGGSSSDPTSGVHWPRTT